MKKAVKIAVAVYLTVSLLMSVAASLLPHSAVITHRAPFLILEVCESTVEGIHPDGRVFGYHVGGGYIGFGRDAAAYPLGATVYSLFVWNPLNSECDDILARYDFLIIP